MKFKTLKGDVAETPNEHEVEWRPGAYAIMLRAGVRGREIAVACSKLSKLLMLPGGGQKTHESFHEALERECLEELGVRVRAQKDPFHIAEVAIKKHDGYKHLIQVFFMAQPVDMSQAFKPIDPDIEWARWMTMSEIRMSACHQNMVAGLKALDAFFKNGKNRNHQT